MNRDDEWSKWSDAEIARRCHVSHMLVGNVRRAITCNISGDANMPPVPIVRHDCVTVNIDSEKADEPRS